MELGGFGREGKDVARFLFIVPADVTWAGPLLTVHASLGWPVYVADCRRAGVSSTEIL